MIISFILESRRLIIRNFLESDIEELVDYRNNILCSKYQRGQFHSKEKLENFIIDSLNYDIKIGGEKYFAIAKKDSNVLVGNLFVAINDITITLGYTISYKYHRQGFAFEILTELISYLHDIYPAHEIVAMTEKDNIASMKLLEKLNFTNEGYSDKIESYIFSIFTKSSMIDY